MRELAFTLRIELLKERPTTVGPLSFDDIAPTTSRPFRVTLLPQSSMAWSDDEVDLAKRVAKKTIRMLIEGGFRSTEIDRMELAIRGLQGTPLR